jgi:hypothetical protein
MPGDGVYPVGGPIDGYLSLLVALGMVLGVWVLKQNTESKAVK